MGNLSITIDEKGLDAIVLKHSPKKSYTILMRWYDEGSRIFAEGLRQRAPSRLKGKVRIKMDKVRPPRWCRIDVRSPLAHMIEGGTGPAGDPAFNHRPKHFPRVTGPGGIMESMGVSQSEGFLIARSISRRGGNRAKPFIRPTFAALHGQVEALMDKIATEEMAG